MILNLSLRAIEATNVPKMDFIGKSDPYVKAKISHMSQFEKTITIDNCDSPTWNHDFSFQLHEGLTGELLLELWDEDVKFDEIISTLNIPLSLIAIKTTHNQWFDMKPAPKVKKGGGKIHLLIHIDESIIVPYSVSLQPNSQVNFNLKILEGYDIPKMDVIGSCDPYCTFRFTDADTMYRTKVCTNTLKPNWNEEFLIPLTSMNGNFELTLYDKDVGSDEIISVFKIPISLIQQLKCHDIWISPTPAKGIKLGGKIHVVIHIAPSSVRPFS